MRSGDILDVIDPNDREYFRRSREERFGMSLEKLWRIEKKQEPY